ncbi:MAG TPA: FtsX-like permease family protein [Ruminiclostridium sp.]
MNKIWMLSISNIRKSKGAYLSLILIIFVAAILLNLGLLTSLNFKKSFDNKVEELHSAHVAVTMLKQTYQDNYEDYFKTYPGVTETEKDDILYLMGTKFKYGSGEFSNPAFFLNASTKRNISHLAFVGEHKDTGDRDIYVSYLLHTGGGYELGDKFVINYREKEYVFNIAGFTEDILLGSTNVGGIGFHLPQESYKRFQRELNDENTNGVLLQARLENSKDSQNMIMNFQKNNLKVGQTGMISAVWLCSLSFAKTARTATADIGAVIIISFSLIIVLVSLLVIKFRVSTSIEDGIADIGTLKALGYTSHQIIASILLQFMLIAFFGSVFGIAASYAGVGQLSSMFCAQTGIVWKQGFDLISSVLSLMLILFSVLLITPFSARRIKKLHPIIALRAGITTHSFKKNHCPLDRMKGSLNFVLAIKSLVSNLRQNLMISLIIAAISFASVFGLVMYYNIATDNKAFIDMIGIETCTVSVTTIPGEDAKLLLKDIEKLDGIRKVINYNYGSVTINDEASQVYISDDFSLVDNNQVYEGRYPKYDNEIAINGSMAEEFGKTVGDTISVKMGNGLAEYLITGLSQSANFVGMDVSLTLEGVKRIKSDYIYNSINIYLEDESNVDIFIDEITNKFGNKIAAIVNLNELMKSQLGSYVKIISIVTYLILIVTALVVVMILYLIIKAMIISRRKEFGIQKALGYTTLQLMTQTSMSFLPVVLLGAILGSIVGSFYINSLLSVLFKGIGVMKVAFVVPYLWIGFMCIGICALSYAVSMLVSWRLRKITAYALMVE